MRLFLIFHGRYPSEKAASLFAAKSAEAFANAGADLTLIVPERLDRDATNPYEYYGIPKNFETAYVKTIDLFSVPVLGPLAFSVSYLVFAGTTLSYLLVHADRSDAIYSNEALPLLIASLFFKNTTYEMHDFPEKKKWFYRLLFNRVGKIIATNRWKAGELQRRFRVAKDKIVIEPNAVDLSEYEELPTRKDARAQLNLPEGPIALYTGHLYPWKGVDTLAEAARLMPEVTVYVVGGTEERVEYFRTKYRDIANLRVIGHRPHAEIALWQRAADVLVLPNTAKEEISAHYTSPMKLFEYMASGTPIVASKLPSIEEITEDKRAILVEPDNPQLLAEGIHDALHTGDSMRTANARSWVEDHTWMPRARRIITALVAA